MKTFTILVLLALIGFGVYWFANSSPSEIQRTQEKIGETADAARQKVQNAVGNISWNSDDIKAELTKTGRVVREKTERAGNAIADATADARVTTAIKAKYVGEPGLSAFGINVSTTDGVSTLSGSVDTEADIARAMKLALEVDGCNKVISTLQVKAK